MKVIWNGAFLVFQNKRQEVQNLAQEMDVF